MSGRLVARLPSGPLDVIGDVHGEIDALRELLALLGYDRVGRHPSGRTLVFVGDLGDRGPDSPEVFRLVRQWVAAGRALCLLGNHELNLLLRSEKQGNGWFWPVDHEADLFPNSLRLPEHERTGLLEFLRTLPLIAERQDLRVVHAAWDPPAVRALRAWHDDAVALHQQSEQRIWEELGQPSRPTPEEERSLQNDDPVRVMTSGPEQRARKRFYSGGRWRDLERTRWWDRYTDDVPVIFGHYWRQASGAAPAKPDVPALFGDTAPDMWLGPKRTAMCVDYSVGNRYKERTMGRRDAFDGRLAALRWPEGELVMDDGKRVTTVVGRIQVPVDHSPAGPESA
jgi:hypothetical protein